METFSALLAICAGNSPVPGEFPTQRPVTRSFDVYFDLHPNKRLSKHYRGWWFETLSPPLWRHRNVKALWTASSNMHCTILDKLSAHSDLSTTAAKYWTERYHKFTRALTSLLDLKICYPSTRNPMCHIPGQVATRDKPSAGTVLTAKLGETFLSSLLNCEWRVWQHKYADQTMLLTNLADECGVVSRQHFCNCIIFGYLNYIYLSLMFWHL